MVPEEWLLEAACRSDNADIFFPEDYGTSGVLSDAALEDPEIRETIAGRIESYAKGICMTCPVRLDCLNYALENDERYGIYGGASARDRERIRDAKRKREQRAKAG